MAVPDGNWRVQPISPLRFSSEPEAVDLALTPGQTGRADFTVTPKPGEGERLFIVQVDNERGEALQGAVVEVARAARQRGTDDLADPAEPLRSGITDDGGAAYFDAIDAGSYRIVAGHVDYLEGGLELPGHDPKDPEKPIDPGGFSAPGATTSLPARGRGRCSATSIWGSSWWNALQRSTCCPLSPPATSRRRRANGTSRQRRAKGIGSRMCVTSPSKHASLTARPKSRSASGYRSSSARVGSDYVAALAVACGWPQTTISVVRPPSLGGSPRADLLGIHIGQLSA